MISERSAETASQIRLLDTFIVVLVQFLVPSSVHSISFQILDLSDLISSFFDSLTSTAKVHNIAGNLIEPQIMSQGRDSQLLTCQRCLMSHKPLTHKDANFKVGT